MPGGVSGVDLSHEIRRRRPQMPIVLVTGFVGEADVLDDGHFGLLLKPYTAESLLGALGGGDSIDDAIRRQAPSADAG
jgi:FixJ family two-component response regulator